MFQNNFNLLVMDAFVDHRDLAFLSRGTGCGHKTETVGLETMAFPRHLLDFQFNWYIYIYLLYIYKFSVIPCMQTVCTDQLQPLHIRHLNISSQLLLMYFFFTKVDFEKLLHIKRNIQWLYICVWLISSKKSSPTILWKKKFYPSL
jgi:hypothetical protein